MYKKLILIRFGDLMLKGKNQKTFINAIKRLIKDKLSDLNVTIINTYNRVYLDINDVSPDLVVKRLMLVSGLHSFSFVYKTSLELEDIKNTAIKLIEDELTDFNHFKIETKRAYKQFPHTSLEFSKIIAPAILKRFEGKITVDVKNPTETLTIEIREDGTYLFLKTIKGLGGYPVGTGGKGLVMLSGGIDSPVAAFLALKQGVEIELLHFESSPLTPLESVDKVIKIASKIARYMPKGQIKMHICHFANLHHMLLENVPDPYIITIMRRRMYDIAEKYAKNNDILVLINGESIGQVASQTLESLSVVEAVTRMPIIRPLATYDKNDIIKIAHQIDTYETSIIPFEDCCTVYVPKKPVTKPKLHICEQIEESFDFKVVQEETIKGITTFTVYADKEMKLANYGFDFNDAYEEWKNDHEPSKWNN